MGQNSRMKKNVLIVDDEPNIVTSLQDLLSFHDFNVLTATNGKDALSVLKKSLPDIIVLDVNMPKMNGFEVLSEIKKNPATSEIPVIMVTVRSDETDIRRGVSSYAEFYLTKPFDPQSLIDKINTVLRLKGKM